MGLHAATKKRLPAKPKNKSLIVFARLPCRLAERDQPKANSASSQNTAIVHVEVHTSKLIAKPLEDGRSNNPRAFTNTLLRKYAIARPPKKCMGISRRGYVLYNPILKAIR
jgi:hypothetical protein